jgi:hypothetical protein
MVAATGTSPSRPDGSGSVSFASFTIRSGCNGGLEGALRAMNQLGVDIGFLLETKLTGGIYTRYSSGYSVLASTATSVRQGGIALFWRGNNSYEVEETRIWGVNVINLQLRMDNVRFFVVGCYIPPSNLETLTDVERAWQACPTGAHPLLVGNMNFNFCAPRTDCEEAIAEQVEAMSLRYVQTLLPTLGETAPGDVDVVDEEGGEMDLLSVRLLLWKGNRPSKIPTRKRPDASLLLRPSRTGRCHSCWRGEELNWYRRRMQRFPISLPRGPWKQLDAEYEELQRDVVPPPPEGAPSQQLDHHRDMETCRSPRNAAQEGHALPNSSAWPRPASKSAITGRPHETR